MYILHLALKIELHTNRKLLEVVSSALTYRGVHLPGILGYAWAEPELDRGARVNYGGSTPPHQVEVWRGKMNFSLEWHCCHWRRQKC